MNVAVICKMVGTLSKTSKSLAQCLLKLDVISIVVRFTFLVGKKFKAKLQTCGAETDNFIGD